MFIIIILNLMMSIIIKLQFNQQQYSVIKIMKFTNLQSQIKKTLHT